VWGSAGTPLPVRRRSLRTLELIVSTNRVDGTPENSEPQHLELPVEELLRRARPLPAHDQMVIDDLTEEEGAAFLAAVES